MSLGLVVLEEKLFMQTRMPQSDAIKRFMISSRLISDHILLRQIISEI